MSSDEEEASLPHQLTGHSRCKQDSPPPAAATGTTTAAAAAATATDTTTDTDTAVNPNHNHVSRIKKSRLEEFV